MIFGSLILFIILVCVYVHIREERINNRVEGFRNAE